MTKSTDRILLRGRVVLPDGVMEDGMVVIRGERLEYVGPASQFPVDEPVKRHPGFLWPGLIDLHVHGAGGSDVMDGTPAALRTISEILARHGVTGFLATTVTMDKAHLERAMSNVAEQAPLLRRGAEILGIHLEGPWICPQYRGAQNPEFIRNPEPGDADWAWEASRGWLRLVTLAPERPGAGELIRQLVRKGVIASAGHTGASYEEMMEAVEAGVSHVTHCFNGMTGLHHRRPGAAGAALLDDRLIVELICDGHHVHPAVVRLLAKVKGPDRLILISDGIRAVDQPEGVYELGGLPVFIRDGKAMLEDGSLAGSLLTLDEAVRKMARYAKVPLWEAVRMASLIPARRLGLDGETGSLETGKLANVVLTDEECRVCRVWIRGREIAGGRDGTC